MLILPIKKKWFDMIKSGEKKEEYREIKPYWTKRFENYYEIAKLNIELECPNFKEIYYRVVFRNGYGNNEVIKKYMSRVPIYINVIG